MNLNEAVTKKQEALVRQMIANNSASISQQEFFQAFLSSVREGGIEIIKLLIPYVDINAKAVDSGLAALHVAAQMQNPYVVKLLLEHGANINIQDSAGQTPLHTAIDSELSTAIDLSDDMGCYIPACATVSALLIYKGADVNIKSSDGSTPLDWASDHKAAEQILHEHGAVKGRL